MVSSITKDSSADEDLSSASTALCRAFPGNIAQFTGHHDAFGLANDATRFVRLLFQPALVGWAIGATDAWRVLTAAYRARSIRR